MRATLLSDVVGQLIEFTKGRDVFTMLDLRTEFRQSLGGDRFHGGLPPVLESAFRSLLDERVVIAVAPGRYRFAKVGSDGDVPADALANPSAELVPSPN